MPSFHHQVLVGGAELPGNIFLAPVAGYSDAAFRSVCVGEGADLCYTEMVSSEALTRGHSKTKELLARAENETAYAIQLFGAHPEVMARAAELLLPYKPLIVDLNCAAAPSPRSSRRGRARPSCAGPNSSERSSRPWRRSSDPRASPSP